MYHEIDKMFFDGFLLDFNYGLDWRVNLRKAGWEVSEVGWQRYVEEYNRGLPHRRRAAPPDRDIPPMGPTKDLVSFLDSMVWSPDLNLNSDRNSLMAANARCTSPSR